MKSDIIEILNQANFTSHFTDYIEKVFPENYANKFKQPYHNEVKVNPLLHLAPKERLFSSLIELVELKEYYLNKEIPLPYFHTNIYDLSYRLERHHQETGVYGISERDLKWLVPLFKADIFDLGSLRFQRFWFSSDKIEREGYDYMPLSEKWKRRFPKGTPMIEIHIQTNTNFSKEKVDEAFVLANIFFERYFSEHEYQTFICRTWLLYPKTRDLLNKTSNIASFSRRFEVIATNQNSKQALDRIYETSDLEEIEAMKKNSSLEKTAYRNLDKLGVAAGIIYK